MLTIAYAVYQKIFSACFAYADQTGHCVIETLQENSCTILESSSPGYKKQHAFKYNNNSLQLCNSLLCDFECTVLIENVTALPSETNYDKCVVANNIQLPFTIIKRAHVVPKLHGQLCSNATHTAIPEFSFYKSINNNFDFVTGDFSITVIIVCAVVLTLLTIQFTLFKKPKANKI